MPFGAKVLGPFAPYSLLVGVFFVFWTVCGLMLREVGIMKILIAEDDVHTREGLCEILAGEGYQVCAASNGKEALAKYVAEKPDLVCLDIMMPDVSGYDVCREIRRDTPKVPILFISAKSEEIDKVVGLEMGADDYIVKPFGVKEVVARVRAVMRRVQPEPAAIVHQSFQMKDLTVVPDALRVYRNRKPIDVGARDMQILVYFHENRGKVLDRDTLMDHCWGVNYMPESRA
jgi:DNA-binding response OmpR family regulator